MEIDLTNQKNLTIDNVKLLIASKDDSVPRQLRVSKKGIAFLSDEIGNINISDLICRFETWDAGNGYTGLSAASDEVWVQKVFNMLTKAWPEPESSYIDY